MIRIVDRVAIATAVSAAAYLAVRGTYFPVNDLLPGGTIAKVVMTSPVIADSTVVYSTAAGTLRVTCRQVGFDRAGPDLAGTLVIFADLNGQVEAMTRKAVVDCVTSGGR